MCTWPPVYVLEEVEGEGEGRRAKGEKDRDKVKVSVNGHLGGELGGCVQWSVAIAVEQVALVRLVVPPHHLAALCIQGRDQAGVRVRVRVRVRVKVRVRVRGRVTRRGAH